MIRTRGPWLDRVGAVVGMGCALHCLALPLVVGMLPLVGATLLSHPMAEVVLLGTALVLGAVVARDGFRGPRRSPSTWVLVVGVGLLGLRLVLGEDGVPGEPWATPAISLVLAAGHLARAQEARACRADWCSGG
jgi:hypothetical protein